MRAQAAASRPGATLLLGLALLLANPLAFSPGGELLELARERHSVVAHELHERTRGFGVGRDPHACELSSNPRLEIARLRNVVAEQPPMLLGEVGQGCAAQRVLCDESEHGAGDRISKVHGDRVHVSLPPALDSVDDDESPPVLAAEEAERVAGRDGVFSARRLRLELFGRLGAEARAQPAERAKMLRPIGADQQVNG